MSKIGTATNKKIIEIYNDMQSGLLILQPSFQRKLVWNSTHKENFIDTILGGYPFPEVYFADGEIDLEKRLSQTVVVDGQQRLNTIYQYITNDPELILKRIKRFQELTAEEQTAFFDYNVVVRDLGRIAIEQIREIFNRINSVQYALNAMEINNALYEGEFICAAKAILNSGEMDNIDIFGDTDISRMKDLEFVVLIMATVEIGGYFTGDKEVENMIVRYDDEYLNKDTMVEYFVNCLKFISQLNLNKDSLWFRKSSLYSLICELMFYINRYRELPDLDDTKRVLINLEEKISMNKTSSEENEYSSFYKYIFQQTTSRKGRNIRGKVLREYFDAIKK